MVKQLGLEQKQAQVRCLQEWLLAMDRQEIVTCFRSWEERHSLILIRVQTIHLLLKLIHLLRNLTLLLQKLIHMLRNQTHSALNLILLALSLILLPQNQSHMLQNRLLSIQK